MINDLTCPILLKDINKKSYDLMTFSSVLVSLNNYHISYLQNLVLHVLNTRKGIWKISLNY